MPAPALRTLADGDEVQVLWEEVSLGDRTVTIERPEDPGSLIQGWCERADPDILIPYWAEIWPSSRAIAKRLEREPLDGMTVLDLGCGLGVAGIAAGLAGGHVTFADNHPDALTFAKRNASEAGLAGAEFMLVDWRAPDWARPFDRVIGADVIYDRSEHEPIADLLEKLLAEGGTAWLGEPSRDSARAFLDEWLSRGWFVHSARVEDTMVHELTTRAR